VLPSSLPNILKIGFATITIQAAAELASMVFVADFETAFGTEVSVKDVIPALKKIQEILDKIAPITARYNKFYSCLSYILY